MKKTLLTGLISLFILSCIPDIKTDGLTNSTSDKEHDKEAFFYLTVSNMDYYHDFSISILDLYYSTNIKPKNKLSKLVYPIESKNLYTVEYKDIMGNSKYYTLKKPEEGQHYILSYDGTNISFEKFIGNYSLLIANETTYSYKVEDLYNNTSFIIDPSKSQEIKNLPCNLTNRIFFHTNFSGSDPKYTQFFATFKKTTVDYVYKYSITETPNCDKYNLCYLILKNQASDNFRLLDNNNKEILVSAPGKTASVAVTAGANKIIIQQKDGYFFFPDEYSFDGLIPKCGTVEFTVTDNTCTWKAYN